ncbi:hypothetical protein F7731_20830 [Cytobacillus depressus]|uniref:Uncharacterized protein n=1 Tax=Cytobacillus depressus TaxID=1602942 RepID=A0A6L3V1S9_9BACI|nr:hypothetical protein F7731_20830 [Cytobacillus depressus]
MYSPEKFPHELNPLMPIQQIKTSGGGSSSCSGFGCSSNCSSSSDSDGGSSCSSCGGGCSS